MKKAATHPLSLRPHAQLIAQAWALQVDMLLEDRLPLGLLCDLAESLLWKHQFLPQPQREAAMCLVDLWLQQGSHEQLPLLPLGPLLHHGT